MDTGCYGINVHVPTLDALEEVQACGIRWVRVDVHWDKIQLAPGLYDWYRYDWLFGQCQALGLRVLANITGEAEQPTIGEDWDQFCYAVAARYRPTQFVAAWSIWNEPNLERFWKHDFDWYSRLWGLGAARIKEANHEAVVVGPDLAHLTGAQWDVWLRRFLERHAAMIDVVSHHCYPSDDTADNLRMKLERGEKWPWCSPALRDVLDWCGWDGPVWLTETGVKAKVDLDGHLLDGDAPMRQAQFYHDLLREAFWPDESWSTWLEKVFFYEIHDDPRYHEGWGICGSPPELTRRPSWFAYSEAIEAFRSSR